jgi:caffeoyl-CoA O-methyltransferase
MKEVKMKSGLNLLAVTAFLILSMIGPSGVARSQPPGKNLGLDAKVISFLKDHSNQWHDMNVPDIDGKILYNWILKNNYRKALEIGTSTGRSGIWIAWALSKTGGKLVTIEIDESR